MVNDDNYPTGSINEADPLVRALRAGMLKGFPAPKRKVRTWNYGSSVIDNRVQLFLVSIMMAFLEAWFFMLLMGIFAGYLAIPGLAIGYWACMGIKFLWATAKGTQAMARDYF